MPLNALLLSKDESVIQVLRSLLPELGIQIDQCGSPESARRSLVNRKYEAIIVDADTPDNIDFMMGLRQLPMTRDAIIFAIIYDMTVTVAFQGGANFVLEKPLSPERAMRSFRAAQGLILRERRRYYRHPVEMFATLEYGSNNEGVTMTNLSEGGMAINVTFGLTPGLMVKWKFDLPEGVGPVEGKGEVTWADIHGHAGIRFVHIPLPFKVRLEDWLRERAGDNQVPSLLGAGCSEKSQPQI